MHVRPGDGKKKNIWICEYMNFNGFSTDRPKTRVLFSIYMSLKNGNFPGVGADRGEFSRVVARSLAGRGK